VAKFAQWMIGAAAVATVGGAGWALWRSQQPSPLPAVAEVLPAATTVGFVAVEGVDAVSRHGFASLASILPADITTVVLDPTARKLTLGLDPSDPVAWQQAGLVPARGLAAVWDTQTGAAPLALAAVADRAANQTWWQRIVTGVPADAFVSGKTSTWPAKHAVTGAALRLTTAEQGAWRVAQAADLAAEVTGGAPSLQGWLDQDGPRLTADPVFQAAFAEAPTGPRIVGLLRLDNLLALFPGLGTAEERKTAQAMLTQSYRAVAGWWAPGQVGFRLVTTSVGAEILRKLLAVEASPDAVVAALPANAALALRFSINLHEALDAIADQIPPQFPQAKQGFVAARLAMPLGLGIGETEFGASMTGQFAFAMIGAPSADVAGQSMQVVLVAGIRDSAKAESLLQRLADKVGAKVGAAQNGVSAVTFAEMTWYLHRNAEAWVVTNGPLPTAGAAPAWQGQLRGPAVFALSADPTALYPWLRLVLGAALAEPPKAERWQLAITRDAVGLLGRGTL